jgi:hypothetical protein
MTDHSSVFVIEILIKVLSAESQGRTATIPQFQPHEQEAQRKAICFWLSGRGKMTDEEVREVDMAITPPPLTMEETIASLKRIHKIDSILAEKRRTPRLL